MKEFLEHLLDLRPKDETDYCTFLFWQMSRKLAVTLVAALSICCVCILWSAKPVRLQSNSIYKTYRYDALFLKFATGKAEILGKSGYTAYIGDVDHGVVKGSGTLYDLQGNKVYEGEFDNNAYNGVGKYYYPNGMTAYEGEFQDNLYSGEGKLYRENGTLWYDGAFSQGYMDGEGVLYNAAQEKLYDGFFKNNQVFYQELIGKSTAEVAGLYFGRREVYTGDGLYCVHMKEIDGIYFCADRSNTLNEDFQVSGLYVLKPEICLEGNQLDQISQLEDILGIPIYEGNTYLEPEDEVALNICCEAAGGEILYGKAGYQSSSVFDDVTEVYDFDRDYQAYIYVFEKDGIVYTFFCKERNAGFAFYRMEE